MKAATAPVHIASVVKQGNQDRIAHYCQGQRMMLIALLVALPSIESVPCS